MKDIKSIVAVFAHPDDEAFSSGGTLARFASSGARITLVCATDGREGGKGMTQKPPPQKMKRIRNKELGESAKSLGISNVICWHYRDKRLARASRRNIVRRLKAEFGKRKPDLILTFGDDGFTGHTDHIAISRFVTSAFRTWHERSTSRLWHTTHHPKEALKNIPKLRHAKQSANIIVRIRLHGKAKLRAIHAHQTQVFSRARIGVNGENVRKIFFEEEAFFQVYPKKPGLIKM